MNFVAMIACLLVAVENVDRALGIQPQHLFTQSALWVWWLPATTFALSGLFFGIRGLVEAINKP